MTQAKSNPHRVLVAVDGSDASAREIEYVVDVIGHRHGTYLHLVHVLPPVKTPAGAALGPDASAPGGGAGRAEARARELLGRLKDRVRSLGVHSDHVDTGVLAIDHESGLVDGLLEAARDQGCRTIVVGRNSLPWYRELLHHHPADELVKRAAGFAVWVVE